MTALARDVGAELACRRTSLMGRWQDRHPDDPSATSSMQSGHSRACVTENLAFVVAGWHPNAPPRTNLGDAAPTLEGRPPGVWRSPAIGGTSCTELRATVCDIPGKRG